MKNNEPIMVWRPDPRMANDNDQTNNWVESGKYEEELVDEDVNSFTTGIGLLIFAPFMYFGAHYILYEYFGAWLLEYGSYFFALSGIVFLIFGVIGKILNRKTLNDN